MENKQFTEILGETPSNDYQYPGTYLDCDKSGSLVVYTKNLGTSSEFYIPDADLKTELDTSGCVKIQPNASDDLSSSKIFIGDYSDTNNTGIVYVYSSDGTGITNFATGLGENSYSGYSIDITNDGEKVAVAERDKISVWKQADDGNYNIVGDYFNNQLDRGTDSEGSSP